MEKIIPIVATVFSAIFLLAYAAIRLAYQPELIARVDESDCIFLAVFTLLTISLLLDKPRPDRRYN